MENLAFQARNENLQAGLGELSFWWVSGSAPMPNLEKKLREMALPTLPA